MLVSARLETLLKPVLVITSLQVFHILSSHFNDFLLRWSFVPQVTVSYFSDCLNTRCLIWIFKIVGQRNYVDGFVSASSTSQLRSKIDIKVAIQILLASLCD